MSKKGILSHTAKQAEDKEAARIASKTAQHTPEKPNKHKPGITPWPWSLDIGSGRGQHDIAPSIMANGVTLTTLYGRFTIADARLIAAAPELLAALSAIINEGGPMQITQATVTAARAAILRATEGI